jgi:hypothetical protein
MKLKLRVTRWLFPKRYAELEEEARKKLFDLDRAFQGHAKLAEEAKYKSYNDFNWNQWQLVESREWDYARQCIKEVRQLEKNFPDARRGMKVANEIGII